jgi:hypothetical protein
VIITGDAGTVNEMRGTGWLRAVILGEFAIAAAAIAVSVRGAIALYHRPQGCVDTCFQPLLYILIGMGAGFLLIVGAAVTLILTTVVERRRIEAGVPLGGGVRILVAGTKLAAAGALVPLLAAEALLFIFS